MLYLAMCMSPPEEEEEEAEDASSCGNWLPGLIDGSVLLSSCALLLLLLGGTFCRVV